MTHCNKGDGGTKLKGGVGGQKSNTVIGGSNFLTLDRAKMRVRTFILPIMRVPTFVMGK